MSSQHKEDSVVKIGLNLGAIALGAGLILATINYFTTPIRLKNEENMQNEAKRAVLPTATTFVPMVGHEGWFEGKTAAGEVAGYVIPIRQKGFDGFIEMMVGATPDFKVVDYKIIKDKETPGLGAKAKEPFFRERFYGKGAEQIDITKTPDPSKILAITGSTITSRAVAGGVKRALTELQEAKQNTQGGAQ